MEVFNWCKIVVLIGVIFGIVVIWGLCVGLWFFVLVEFFNIFFWEVSLIGIISGIIVGVVIVFIVVRFLVK